jgi:cell division protein FtsI (penicillin-binding protein 3)
LPLSLQPVEQAPEGKKVFSASTVRAIRRMLERVVSDEGTARLARVPRYRVGGKTGTTHKLIDGNYKNKRYVSWFVGMAPMSAPEFVLAVMIDDPASKAHYGGSVAGPVFARLMKDTLRLYNVVPDDKAALEHIVHTRVHGGQSVGGGA